MNNTVKVQFSYDWCKAVANGYEPQLTEFSEYVGIADEAKSAKILVDCYYLFFTPAVISVLITQTLY